MTKKTPDLSQKLSMLPEGPGIYLMKDARGEVIYVGKAADLRARVRGYFRAGSDEDRLITRQIGEVADVDVVVAGSEKEALILETNFIKQFRPRYNVLYRDDKSFVSIKIPTREPWPRPSVTRKLDDERALYFGPYANARAARETVRLIQDVFPLRKCSARQCREARRPCLYAQMGKCLAPCCAEVSPEQYGRLVEEVVLFLRGRSDDLLRRLRRQMKVASAGLDFERAARLRDRLRAVETTLEKQRVGASGQRVNRDVFGLAEAGGAAVWVSVLFVRSGNLQDVATYRFRAELDSAPGIFRSFLHQFYAANRFIPEEVLLPVEDQDAEALAQWLSEKRGRKVSVRCPKRGEKRRLVELANHNARQAEQLATSGAERRREEMESLRRILHLRRLPRRIECFDISNLQGREAVGSMVVFRDGEPEKSSYRRFRIRSVRGQDDCAMLAEVLERRCRRARQASGGAQTLPELIVVDGGPAQLGAARAVLREAGAGKCEVVALAKARSAGGRRVRVERVFAPGRADAIPLPEHAHGTHLIVRVRDEAHRFAVAYHRRLRAKAAMRSPLTEVPGVGPRLAERLLERFGTPAAVAQASLEELEVVRGVSERVARLIRQHLRRPAGPSGSAPAG